MSCTTSSPTLVAADPDARADGVHADSRRGRHSSLPALGLQYADYAVWHRELVEQGGLTRIARSGIASSPSPRRRSICRRLSRPAERSSHGAEVRHRFDSDLTAGLQQLGRAAGASIFMTLLACVKVLLYRYSGQRDVTVGSPIAGRVRKELADQIGFYVNMLPLRTSLRADESFASLLDRIARKTSEALEHEIYPFDQLVHELHLDRRIGRSPLFDVVLVVEKSGDAALEFEGLTARPLELPRRSSKFDLTFHFVECEGRLDLVVEYSTDLFQRPRIVRLVQHLEQLVRAVVGSAHWEIGRIPIMPSTNAGASRMGPRQTRAALRRRGRLSPWAETRGGRGDSGQRLTHGELNVRANRWPGNGGARRRRRNPGRTLPDRSTWPPRFWRAEGGGAYVPPIRRIRRTTASRPTAVLIVPTRGAESMAAAILAGAADLGDDAFGARAARMSDCIVHPIRRTSSTSDRQPPKGCAVTTATWPV